MKRLLVISCGLLALAACSPKPVTEASASASAPAAANLDAGFPKASIDGLPAGDYTIDPAHASLTFKVNHLGFSHYTARFAKFDAKLNIDPAHPEAATLTAHIDPQSLALNAPPAGFHDELMGKGFFDAKLFPDIDFVSTKVEKTGDFTARVTGNLTLHGVTKPATMDVTFNGGYPGLAGVDPHARIGFSATGQLKRSDFGMGAGVPAPGSRLGVSDEVDFAIDAEMAGPALKAAPAAAAASSS